MTDINLRKIQLLNVSAAYAVIEACDKVVSRMGKYKQDLSKELLTPLVDSLAFIGKATKDPNQLRRDILKSRLPAKMKQLTRNVPAESELFFEDDLNKRIIQINNNNSALSKPAFIRPNQNGRHNKRQVPYNTTSNNRQKSKNGYPPGITSAPKIPHSEQEIKVINTEIKKFLAKGVIMECERDKGGFISTIFTRQKKDGSF